MSYCWSEQIPRALPLRLRESVWALLLAGCVGSGTFSGQVFRQGAVAYRVGTLPEGWTRSRSHGANLAFHHAQGGMLIVNGECPLQGDAPLDVLTNHLLFGVTAQKEIARTLFSLDGREALRTHLTGQLDGVPIELSLVVLKKDGCLYDFQLIAGPEQFASREPDFHAFVAGFSSEIRR